MPLMGRKENTLGFGSLNDVPQRLKQRRSPGRVGAGTSQRRLLMIACRFTYPQLAELHNIAVRQGTSVAAIVRAIVAQDLRARNGK